MTKPVRPEDQALPVTNNTTPCQTTFLTRINDEMPARLALGIQRYGTALQPFNGRDAMRDAWEEFLDLGVYLEQLHRERAVMIDLLQRIAEHDAEARRLLVFMGEAVGGTD